MTAIENNLKEKMANDLKYETNVEEEYFTNHVSNKIVNP